MPKTSKINIFNIMTEEELEDELKNPENSRREYQRFVAMNCLSMGMPHNVTAEIIGVSYRTINRWANACSKGGIDNLKPSFNGGRPSRLSNNQRLEFANHLFLNEGMSMTEAKDYLNETFNLDFSLTYITTLVESLGFEYCTHRPEFLEAPENKEEIIIERIDEANITENDIVIGVDESTMKTGIRTKKGIYFKNSKKNEKK